MSVIALFWGYKSTKHSISAMSQLPDACPSSSSIVRTDDRCITRLPFVSVNLSAEACLVKSGGGVIGGKLPELCRCWKYMSGGGAGNSSEPARGMEVWELSEPGGVYSFGGMFPIESCEETDPKKMENLADVSVCLKIYRWLI